MARHEFIVMAFVLFIAGCEDQSVSELRSWMQEARSQVKSSEKKSPPPDSYKAHMYQPGDRLDPFDIKKMHAAALVEGSLAGMLQPDQKRYRDLLESYPIEQLKMVGSLRRPGHMLALIEAEKIIYQVKVGSYLGQDQGKVVKIEEKNIEIEEMVQDANGNWNSRRTQLSLKEK